MTDDEIRARLRASFQATAARATISNGRLHELTVAANRRRVPPLVATMSAAAAVAAVAAVATVIAGVGSGGSTVSSASGGSTLLASSSVDAAASGECTPENYAVIASTEQLAGLRYMLPSTPAGYQLYGAWGTISRNGCLDSATWYVQYNRPGASDGTGSIQIVAHHAGDAYPMPPSASATPVTVAGRQGWFLDLNGKGIGVVSWSAGDVDVEVFAPLSSGRDAFLALAGSVVEVKGGDPRIQPPANCDVPPGNVCPTDRPKVAGSSSPSASATAEAGVPIG